jgi:hypothetical protein
MSDWENQFQVAARSAFGFLVDDYGFREPDFETVINPTALGGPPTLHAFAPIDGRPAGVCRFIGPRSTVEIAHDPRGEIHVGITDHRTGRNFSLQHVIRFTGADPNPYGFAYSGGYDAFVNALQRLAEALRSFGGPWLNGHPEAVDALARYAEVVQGLYTAKFTNDRRPGTLADRLYAAIWNRDFAKLRRLLERIPGPRTEIEQKALAYASEQLQLERARGRGSSDHDA